MIRLIDQTDGGHTEAWFYDALSPLAAQRWSDETQHQTVPSSGGLMEAVSGDVRTSVIVVPDPNDLMTAWRSLASSRVPVASHTVDRAMALIDGYNRWRSAELTGDPFAQGVRDKVVEHIGAALRELLAGPQWVELDCEEEGLWTVKQIGDRAVQPNLAAARVVTHTDSVWRDAFDRVSNGLWQWVESSEADLRIDYQKLISEFAEIVSRIVGRVDVITSRFLITLAEEPGRLSPMAPRQSWDPQVVRRLLKETLQHPEAYQLARLAVSGLQDQVGDTDKEGE